jgi:hypothetical protein
MASLATQVDRIIYRILASYSTEDLIFERTQMNAMVTYILRVNQIRIGVIEIEQISTPPSRTRLSFTAIYINEELSEKFFEFYRRLIESIKIEAGRYRWEIVKDCPEPDDLLSRIALAILLSNNG